MFKIIKILVVLLFLSAIGIGVYWFLNKDDDENIINQIIFAYPREMAQISDTVGIEKHDAGYTLINANNRSDLFFMQGYHHGKEFGEEIDILRRLFKGERVPELPLDLRQLASLFYYLDLEPVARASWDLYTPQMKVILSKYVEGINQAAQFEQAWTHEDTLLLQRGYAFIMGRNFTKEWSAHAILGSFQLPIFQAICSYPVGNFGALADQVQLSSDLDALMTRPPLETVRLFDGKRVLGTHVRTHPWLAFVFEPMVLELNGVYRADGLALAGQPFLWVGKTGKLTFYRQVVLGNDEQFFSIPKAVTSIEGSGFFVNSKATRVDDYPTPPMHCPQGRRVTNLIDGKKDLDYFYYWDGLRPSADLSASYYLLETETVDEALSVYLYQQVPATELTLFSKSGQTVSMLSYPSDPSQIYDSGGLFSGPYTRIGRPLPAVTGIHAINDIPWKPDDAGKTAISQLDQELIALVRFYLKGPINEKQIPEDLQENILMLLSDKASIERDYFLQQLWYFFLQLLKEDHLNETTRPAVDMLSLESRRLILAVYGRGSRDVNIPLSQQIGRTKVVANILKAAWEQWMQVVADDPSFFLPNKWGKLKKKTVDIYARSADAGTAWFFVENGNEIKQVATYTLVWGNPFRFWQYEYAHNGRLGKPMKKSSPDKTGDMFLINPKI